MLPRRRALGKQDDPTRGRRAVLSGWCRHLRGGVAQNRAPMPAEPTPKTLSTRALNRATLQRQWLLQRRAATPAVAIEHLVGLQAQHANAPYLALWSRLAGFELAALTRLIEQRRVVRCALLRSTLHLASARDLPALRGPLQPVLDRGLQASQHGKQLAGVDLRRVGDAARALLARTPMPTGELGAALALQWPGRDPSALAAAARCQVPLVHVPPDGTWNMHKPPALVPAEHWLGRAAAAEAPPDAAQRLLLRYLKAFGPASAADIATWSGLQAVAPLLASLDDRLVRYRDERGRVLVDLARTRLPDPDTAVPVRLLPGFDNLLLSHADRARVLDDAHRPRVFGANGLIQSVVLVDGFVRATWRVEIAKANAELVVAPFAALAPAQRAEIEAEAQAWLAVAHPDAVRRRVRFG